MAEKKHTWFHNRQCDYCLSVQSVPESFVYGSLTVKGCRHFRGGKSRKHGRRSNASANR